jgi:putative ATP-grasp target RiPP
MSEDPFGPTHHFPLGKKAGAITVSAEWPEDRAPRPFGLRFLADPVPDSRGALDWTAVEYDPQRQIAVIRDGDALTPVFKHTNNQTTTTTGVDDRKAPDSDTDVGGND